MYPLINCDKCGGLLYRQNIFVYNCYHCDREYEIEWQVKEISRRVVYDGKDVPKEDTPIEK